MKIKTHCLHCKTPLEVELIGAKLSLPGAKISVLCENDMLCLERIQESRSNKPVQWTHKPCLCPGICGDFPGNGGSSVCENCRPPTISAQRRRAEIQEQLSKNRKKTQELMATRRKAILNPWDKQEPRSDKCPDCEELALCSFHIVGTAHQPEDFYGCADCAEERRDGTV